MSKFLSVALILFALCALATAQKPVAQLPLKSVDTTWNLPTGGTTWAAHTALQLTSALNVSQPGDVIVLDAGATYVGYFQLPAKNNPTNKWIYIVSSGIGKLPLGKRVTPSDTVNMAKIVTPNTAAALQVNSGANHWRLAGIELTAQSNYPKGCGVAGQPNCMTYFLMSTPWPIASEPDSIVIDRCYLHGSPTQDLQAAIQANWSNTALIDSDVRDVHIKGFDSQAIGAFHSPGPFKITNNYLEAAGENIMFGGSGQNYNAWVPSDITVTGNYIFKPLSWVPISLSGGMVVKNAFELKSAQRVLFDHNTVENVWASAQMGFAVVLTIRSSQSGDVSVVNDVTITNNVLKNVVSGFNTLAVDDQCGAASGYPNCHNAGSQARWNIARNLVIFFDPKLPGGNRNVGINIQPGYDRINGRVGVLRDVVFQHNTLVSAASTACWSSIYFGVAGKTPPFTNLTSNIWIQDNALCRQPTGDWGLQGTAGLTQYMGNPGPLDGRYHGNVMFVPAGDKVQTFPLHNYATPVPFTYLAPQSGNYELATPYWTDTSDGKLAGISYVGLLANYAGGAVPASAQVPKK